MQNKYFVPNTDELFDRLDSTQIFSKLDLRSTYHQVQIKAREESKMACVMHYLSYELTVMPFGLTNAPTTFCAIMNHVFPAFLDKFVVIYLYHILIFNKSLEQHMEHLRLVFETLRAHQLFFNPTKCAFDIKEVLPQPHYGPWGSQDGLRQGDCDR